MPGHFIPTECLILTHAPKRNFLTRLLNLTSVAILMESQKHGVIQLIQRRGKGRIMFSFPSFQVRIPVPILERSFLLTLPLDCVSTRFIAGNIELMHYLRSHLFLVLPSFYCLSLAFLDGNSVMLIIVILHVKIAQNLNVVLQL